MKELRGHGVLPTPVIAGGKESRLAPSPIPKIIREPFVKGLSAYILAGKLCRFWYSMVPPTKNFLGEQFNLYENKAAVSGELGNNDPMPTLDREKDQAFFNELIQNAVIQRGFPFGRQQVFDEEFGDYVSGRIGDSALTDHLKNRVRLYLSE